VFRLQFDIGLHVDCCLGGFVLPFAKELGYEIPPFDFSLPGVSSMSADTHKYGFAIKGTSVVLFRNAELRRHMYFVVTEVRRTNCRPRTRTHTHTHAHASWRHACLVGNVRFVCGSGREASTPRPRLPARVLVH